jgi:hypothetical protein
LTFGGISTATAGSLGGVCVIGATLWRVAQADKAILLLAVVFAAILSYLAIDQLQTFGTVSDYALAFLGGFG